MPECLRKSVAHHKGFTLLLSAGSLIALQWCFDTPRCSRKTWGGGGLEQNAAKSTEVNFSGRGARPLFKGSFLSPKAVLPQRGGVWRGLHSSLPSFSLPPPPPSLLLLLLLAAACLIAL